MSLAKVGKITAGAVLLIGVAGYGALSSIDVESYRGEIIQAAEDATGRKVKITGPIKLKISLTPAVVIEGVNMSNAPWAKDPRMVSIGRAEAEVDLIPAIFGAITVNRLVVHDATINLERRDNGKANWEFEPKVDDVAKKQTEKSDESVSGDAKGDDSSVPSIAIKAVDIKNLKLVLEDAVTKQDISLDIRQLSASANSATDPVQLALDMVYNNLPIRADGSVGPIDHLTANKNTKVDLKVKVPGISVAAKGEITEPMVGKGIDLMVNFTATSYADVGRTLGVDLSEIPPLDFDGKVESFNNAGYRLHNGSLTVADQKLKLSASADLSKPIAVIHANVGAEVFDLPKLLGSVGKGDDEAASKDQTIVIPPQSKTSAEKKVFSADPLPLEQLRSVNADAQMDFGQLILPSGLTLKDAKVDATLTNGKLKVLSNFGLGNGSVSSAINLITPKGAGASSLEIGVNSQNVAVADVVRDMGYADMISGAATNLQVDLKANGSSVRSLMAGLDGKIFIDTGHGIIDNDKLSKAIGSWAVSGLSMIDPGFSQRENTVLKCMVVNVPVKNGIMSINDSVAAETGVLNLVVNGDVNLKTEGLDLGFDTQPHGVGTGVAKTATGLVRMGGTLADPSVKMSLAGAGKAALKVGAAIATGGLSLIGDAVLNEATKDANPCLTAKGEAPKTSSSSQKAPTSGTSESKAVTPRDAIGGALKGLFGK